MEGLLYHYTTSRTAIDYILRTRSLRAGGLAGVNDPKESKFRDFSFYARGAKAVADFNVGFFNEVCEDLANNTYALCFGLPGDGNEFGREEGALHPHMWANYGGRHTGVCLVLDRELLHAEIASVAALENCQYYSGEVQYMGLEDLNTYQLPAYSLYIEDWRKEKEGYFDFHLNSYFKNMFFAKHSDWRDEKEYRWIIRSRKGVTPLVDISKALVKVVVGHEISEPDLYYVIGQCQSLGIPVHRVIWNLRGGLSEDLSRDDVERSLNIESGFSLSVPCVAVLSKVTDNVGGDQVLMVSSSNGYVLDCGDGTDLRPFVSSLGCSDEDMMIDIVPNGFSAGRLAETDTRPLKLSFSDGKMILGEGEEDPYYGFK